MKKLLLLISCIITVTLSMAQSPSFQWAKNLPGQNGTKAVAVDASGNVYSIGSSYGGDFDPSSATYTLPSIYGGTYVSKLDASGNFLWAKQFGGDDFNSPVKPMGLTLDASGNVYVTGYFSGAPDFDPSSATFSITTTMFDDAFIVKLDASGNFVFAKNFGGSNIEQANDIKVDASGNIYTTGKFRNDTDFDPGVGTYTLGTVASSFDVFVSKLDASGDFVWAKNFSGGADETAAALTLDASGNVYVTGGFLNKVDFDPSASVYTITPTNSGQVDVFLVKLDASGNFVWAKTLGGTQDVTASALTIDATNNLYLGGYFSGITDFDPNAGISNLTSNGTSDVFISKYDVSGNYLWAKQFGGTQYDLLFSLALDAANNIYSTGSFMLSVDFDPSANTNTLTTMHTSHSDAFILKLDANGNYGWARQLGSTNLVGTQGNSIVVDASSNLITGGGFQGPVDFDTEATTYTMTASNGYNFIQKMNSGSVGIKENTLNTDLKLYPNPNNGNFNINIENIEKGLSLDICNVLGEKVYNQGISELNTVLDLHLKSGVYFVNITDINGNKAVKKIIVQ